jgi:adenosylcobinamide-phosphate synthase
MIGPLELTLAFALDAVIGDPRWLPHPVRIIGKTIGRSERVLRRRFTGPSQERLAGVLLVLMIVVPSFLLALLSVRAISDISGRAWMLLGTALLVYLVATTIAVRELTRSAKLVMDAVRNGGITLARQRLSMIVGRDTENLTDREVLKAVTETLAENLSDGIVAPLFYLVLGGLPVAMAYKAVNTLDSMVGYKNETYINFGWASARLDDIANYIPSRITGLLIVLSVFLVRLASRRKNPLSSAACSFRIMRRDGRNHASPNSGIPEAAMAGGLGIRMGGPATYGGVMVVKPYIGKTETEDYLSASEDAVMIVQAASHICALVAAFLLFIRSFL